MSGFRVSVVDDADRALAEAGPFLRSDPVQHNLQLTLLEERCARPEPGQYAIVHNGDDVVGLSFRSPLHFHAAITPMPAAAVEPLVDALFAATPEMSGVLGEAGTASRFAGRWAELAKVPAVPVEGQRLYELGSLRSPEGVPGALRPAGRDDVDLVLEWMDGFQRDTDSPTSPSETIAHRIDHGGLVWIWDDTEPVATASCTPVVGGVSRIGFVYTPPERRRRGYAAACTAAVTQEALDAGATRAMLFTQLQNPQSNAIYRRLGYAPAGELLRYRLGP